MMVWLVLYAPVDLVLTVFVSVVTQQLTDGIRLLQLQAHKESAGIKLCHTSCVSTVPPIHCGSKSLKRPPVPI